MLPRAARRLAPTSPGLAGAVSFVLAAVLGVRPAAAQAPVPSGSSSAPPPGQVPPDRGAVSVPRGAGGAVITPPEQPTPGGAGVSTLPRPLNYEAPRYPPEAEAAGLEATVTLQLDIDKQGRVTKAFVVNPAGHGFDEAAVEAAQKLQFEPARKPDGTPFAARILYRYSFTLTAKEGPVEGPEGPKAPEIAEPLAGQVLSSPGEAPLAGATVVVRRVGGAAGGEQSVTTDADGRFRFAGLPPGRYAVSIRATGFTDLDVEEELSPEEPIEVLYRLGLTGKSIEVTVRGAKPPREVTKRTLTRREISRIPGTNGDALRSVQSLPGVARPPGIVGLLIVRGSAPQDTQTFIDGTPVPLIYHFGGLSSVVPTEMIDKIDFYPGNFSAQYGRGMGGIVDAGLRSPNGDGKYHGLVQVDLIDGRLLLEGPVPLVKGWTFAIAGRRSWLDAWLGPALEQAGAGVTQAPVYYDYQALAETSPTPDSRFRLAFFGSDDALELLVKDASPQEPALSGNVGLHTAFQRVQARYDGAIGSESQIGLVTALGRDQVEFGLGAFYFTLEVFSLTGRAELSRRFSKEVVVNVGADAYAALAEVAIRAPSPPRPGEPPGQPFSTRSITEVALDSRAFFPAVYAEAELLPHPRMKIVPGVRAEYYNIEDRIDVSPRVNARFALVPEFPKTTLKGGVGIFQQPPQFQEAIPPIGTEGLRSNRAIQYGFGVEQDLTKQIEISGEGFYKQLDNLVIGRATTSGTSLVYGNTGEGYVIGSEVLLKYKPDERFFGWVAYTLSRSARVDRPGEEERLVPYDQTHILTVLGSYQLGHGWELGARFRLVSGNLVTPNVCNASDPGCDPERTNALFHAASGAYTPIPFSGPASERLPLFHQLDVRVDKRWRFKSWQLSAYLDVQNVYSNANAEAISYNYNYTARQYVNGLPLLPSIGLRGDF